MSKERVPNYKKNESTELVVNLAEDLCGMHKAFVLGGSCVLSLYYGLDRDIRDIEIHACHDEINNDDIIRCINHWCKQHGLIPDYFSMEDRRIELQVEVKPDDFVFVYMKVSNTPIVKEATFKRNGIRCLTLDTILCSKLVNISKSSFVYDSVYDIMQMVLMEHIITEDTMECIRMSHADISAAVDSNVSGFTGSMVNVPVITLKNNMLDFGRYIVER